MLNFKNNFSHIFTAFSPTFQISAQQFQFLKVNSFFSELIPVTLLSISFQLSYRFRSQILFTET